MNYIVPSRKARILAKSGLRYVAGWVDASEEPAVQKQIETAKPRIEAALKDVT